jgi:hypothetical protein
MDKYDVFVSYAWEDKDALVAPLVTELVSRGLRVWYDDLSLDVGDSLRESIDKGLADSRFGVVVLSPSFFSKQWPTRELNGLVQKAMGEGRKVVLPVWHEVTRQDVEEYSYPLADLLAAQSGDGVDAVADAIVRVVSGSGTAEQVATTKREESSQRLIAAARKLISDPNQVVGVNDLTDAIARESYAALTEQYAANFQNAKALDVPAVLADYRRACFGLARLCALGANLGHPVHYGSWERAMAILAREPGGQQGTRLVEDVWQYPVAYLLYATGVAATQRGHIDLVAHLLLDVRAEAFGSREATQLVQWLQWGKVGQFVKSAPDNRHKTPLSENLFETIQDAVMEYFIDEAEYARVFDAFEFAVLMGHLSTAREKQYRWVPPARLMWRQRHVSNGTDTLAAEFERLGGVTLLFRDDHETFTECIQEVNKAASGSAYW